MILILQNLFFYMQQLIDGVLGVLPMRLLKYYCLCNDLMAFHVTGEPLESINPYKLRRRNSETLRAQYINTEELKYVCFDLTILLYHYDLIL